MKVSVVIPAHNEEKNIGECLKYFQKQEEKADEIIVVDNNSTDDTAKIAKSYGARIVKETKQGMIPARNTGFNNAKYEVIARTDADTRVPENWIKIIKENFTKNKRLVGLSGPSHFYDFPLFNKLQHSQWQNKVIFALIKSYIKHATLYGPNMAIRRSAWRKMKDKICLDDRAVHEDTDLAIHLGYHGDIRIDPKLVVATSFRRWKKPYTYLEYSHRLVKTFRRHDLRKAYALSNNVNSYHHPTPINVLSKEFRPSHRVFEDSAVIYLPGWSLNPSSKPVERLCQKFADNLHIRTYAIQTKSENTMNNSLFYEAEAIKELLQELQPSIKRFVLMTHSQGTIKTIYLTRLFRNSNNSAIKGIIFITPVGLYRLSKQELQIKFLGEVVKTIYKSAKEILTFKRHKPAVDLTLAVASSIRKEIKTRTLASYIRKLDRQSQELTSAYPMIMADLREMKIPVAFILAENDLVSSVKMVRNTLKESDLQNVRVIQKRDACHALPYIQTDILIRETGKLAKNLL